MRLSFPEVVRGTWRRFDAPDEVHACEIALAAAFDTGGLPPGSSLDFEVAGSATFDSLVQATPCRGRLCLELSPPWRQRWALEFPERPGLSLHGARVPSLIRPVHGLTTLWADLIEGGAALGLARLHFDWRRDLAALLAGLWTSRDKGGVRG